MDHDHEEYQYLSAINYIIKNGYKKPNRTGTPTISITGLSLRFELSSGTIGTPDFKLIMPLMTTKLTNFRLIASELIWFLSGDTNSNNLRETFNNKIWDANGSREFLNSRGFIDREVGDLGPVYGFQWRHWNGEYPHNPEKPGIDQIQMVIDSIRADPFGRRHVVSAWNPEQIAQMALPPCHSLFHFIVRPNELGKPTYLDCCLYQRSGDMPLGVPFNIASYALLTHMIAHVTDLISGTLVQFIGDAHIYENQIQLCHTQTSRKPYEFPQFEFATSRKNIDDFCLADFIVKNYKHHPRIIYPFSV